MPGVTAADGLVVSARRVTSRVAGFCLGHALDVLEHTLNTPEAAACQYGGLGAGRRRQFVDGGRGDDERLRPADPGQRRGNADAA